MFFKIVTYFYYINWRKGKPRGGGKKFNLVVKYTPLFNCYQKSTIPGWHITQEARKTLGGVQDVAVRPQDDYEPVQGLQHEVGELLVAQERRLPVLFDFLSLQPQYKHSLLS